MQKYLLPLLAASLVSSTGSVFASAEDDLKAFRAYFNKTFPGITDEEFSNGPYGLDENKRIQWEAMEEFPPYEEYVEMGEAIWKKPFKNGKSFASCFGDDPSKVRVKYPHWDSATAKVVTLEGDINKCLKGNGEKPFKWKKGAIAHLGAYLGFEARGQKVNIVVPDDPKAQAAFNAGKQFFYAKRGQLNLACADCHIYNAGKFVRGNLLSTAVGQATHFPVYRAKWSKKSKTGDGLGTMHRRFGGCNKQVRARPFKTQGDEYRNLEYFHAYMSNGLVINAPGYRE